MKKVSIITALMLALVMAFGSVACAPTMPETVSVTGITLNKTETTLNVGETETLTATVKPDNASNKKVTWRSANESIAYVNDNGVVYALTKGNSMVIATTEDGEFSAECMIKVIDPDEPTDPVDPPIGPENISVTNVTLNKSNLSLRIGEQETLIATVQPSDATNKNVSWVSIDPLVARVDNNGKITALSTGWAVIYVRTEDGNKTEYCTVTVTEPTDPVDPPVDPDEPTDPVDPPADPDMPETVSVTGITLNKTEITLNVGETKTLIATVLPINATNKNVSWSSTNSTVANVNGNGKVQSLRAGMAVIIVSTEDGGYFASCLITVVAPNPPVDPDEPTDPVDPPTDPDEPTDPIDPPADPEQPEEGGDQAVTFKINAIENVKQNNQWFSAWESEYDLTKIGSVLNHAQGNEMFAPTGIKISWQEKEGAERYVLEISTTSTFDFASTQKYYLTTQTEYTLNNLVPSSTYYVRVYAGIGSEKIYTDPISFTAGEEIRVVYIDGVSNSRDLGGKIVEGNKRIKYGLIFRTANADAITETGLSTVTKLGIKTEIDLRGKQTATVLGSGIENFLSGDMPQYHELLWVADGTWANGTNETNKAKVEQFKTVFKAFADANNYPLLYHCQIGRDRTGTVSMLLLALLGASEKDIYLDYEASFFSRMCCWDSTETSDRDGLEKCLAQLLDKNIDTANVNFPINDSNNFYATVEWLKIYSGNGSLKTGAEKLLKAVGITDTEIASIRANLLEDV